MAQGFFGSGRHAPAQGHSVGILRFLQFGPGGCDHPLDLFKLGVWHGHGAADVGIVGKDILTEAEADVYELLDTGLGKCRMCVAAPADYQDDPGRPVRVATKFVNIAKAYYASQGRDIDIIKLNGSIELAPILGLSDVIVDIVETGTTLRENGLKVVTEFLPISARFIANKASYQFKHAEMDTMLEKLRAQLQNKEEAK